MTSAEMASSAVRFLERTLDGASTVTLKSARVGLSPERVRALTASARPQTRPTADEIRRSLVVVARNTRASRAGTWGRRGLPGHVVSAMFAEYQRGASCTDVARIFGGTRQSVFEIFKSHGLPLRKKQPRAKILYRGRSYTMGKDYIRATEGGRKPLHHAMWEDAHGPIPEGWSVSFKNADRSDVRLENLFCAPLAEVTHYHRRRHQSQGKAA